MAAKKSSTKTRTVYRTAPKKRARRQKSGITMIPGMGATLGFALSQWDTVQIIARRPDKYGVKYAIEYALRPDQIKKTVIATVGGAIGGEVVKKYAPGVIKRPLGKVAKKFPKVF